MCTNQSKVPRWTLALKIKKSSFTLSYRIVTWTTGLWHIVYGNISEVIAVASIKMQHTGIVVVILVVILLVSKGPSGVHTLVPDYCG